VTTVFVTPDVEEAAYLSDRVIVMAPRPERIRRIADVTQSRPLSRCQRKAGMA
jgi:sulfonate transport system ATP-binding protein